MLIWKNSLSAHELVLHLSWLTAAPAGLGLRTSATTSARSIVPGARSARPKTLRCIARSRHWTVGWRYAPRPGAAPRRSGTTVWVVPSSTTTTRTRSVLTARCRQPTQVRTACARRAVAAVWEISTVVQSSASCDLRSPLTRPGPRYRNGCRSATRSTGQRAGRSGPPCRSPATAGSRGRPHGPPGPRHRQR